MKQEKQTLRNDQRKVLIITWIAQSTEFFITCLRGHTSADIDAGIEHAVDCYLNKNETPGSAIPMGVFHVRQQIKQRREAELIRAGVIDLMARKHQTNRRAYVGI